MEGQLDLREIAESFFALDARFETTVFELYSCLHDPDALAGLFSDGQIDRAINSIHPLTFAIGKEFQGDVLLSREFLLVHDKNISMYSDIKNITMPKFQFSLFASPAIEGQHWKEKSAREAIDTFKIFLATLLGRGFFLSKITTFRISGKNPEAGTSYSTDFFRVPQRSDGLSFLDSACIADVMERIPLQSEPLRSQMILACRFGSSALNEKTEYKRFFDYWTALEILIQGKSQKIRSSLAKAYGFNQNYKFVDDVLLFSEISRTRHELMHKGTFSRLEPDTERRLQAIFIDLARFRVGLPCSRVTEQFVSHDITPA